MYSEIKDVHFKRYNAGSTYKCVNDIWEKAVFVKGTMLIIEWKKSIFSLSGYIFGYLLNTMQLSMNRNVLKS